ncbi:MAG: DUF2795 domain-containing protein [Actinomycetota bacterium]|nr:DUF2795 domain-containing protein [Actinomycetota bacterium]
MRPVTRKEIARHTADAFDYPPATSSDLIEAAAASGARPEVIAVLRRLPGGTYSHLREVWGDLPGIPVDL